MKYSLHRSLAVSGLYSGGSASPVAPTTPVGPSFGTGFSAGVVTTLFVWADAAFCHNIHPSAITVIFRIESLSFSAPIDCAGCMSEGNWAAKAWPSCSLREHLQLSALAD
jgi:hypothetical protein